MKNFLLIAFALSASACAQGTEQTAECAHYVACLEARDEALGISTNMDRFKADGPCWGGSQAGLELCDRACVAGLKFLQERDPNAPEACQP